MHAQHRERASNARIVRLRSIKVRPALVAVLAIIVLMMLSQLALASEQVVYAFKGGNDGSGPTGIIQDSSGDLFGATFYGGSYGNGTIFELSPPAKYEGKWREKILYTLGPGDIGASAGVIVDAAGNLYGTTWLGGATNNGSVFELSPPKKRGSTWTFTTLYSFAGSADGSQPATPLTVDAAGDLYGTTQSGGSGNCGCGTVFQLSPQPDGTWTETTLYNFPGPNGYSAGSLSGVTLDTIGALYGTTFIDSPASNAGTVFQLKKDKKGRWHHRLLYAFDKSGVNGFWPTGNVVFDKSGVLYGATRGDALENCVGASCGTVYQLTPTKKGPWILTTLYEFAGGTDASSPDAGPILDASGNLVGTTTNGGDLNCDSGAGCGAVYKLTQSGGTWNETILHAFSSGRDGSGPGTLLLGAGDILYGLAAFGAHGQGIVFELTP